MRAAALLSTVLFTSQTHAFALMAARAPVRSRSAMSMVATAGTLQQAEGLPIVNDQNFDQIMQSGERVVIDFFADHCKRSHPACPAMLSCLVPLTACSLLPLSSGGPCKLVEPALKRLDASGDVRVVKARLNENPKLRKWVQQNSMKVSFLPTLVLVQDGKPARSMIGAKEIMNDEILSAFAHAEVGVVVPSSRLSEAQPGAKAGGNVFLQVGKKLLGL